MDKVVAHYQYKNHLNNLPTRFNLVTELNKFKEHKEQQQKNNLPDFNQQIVFSVHSQVENLELNVPVSTPFIFAVATALNPFFICLSSVAPPPRIV